MSESSKHHKKSSKTEDDSALPTTSSTDAKRGAFGKSRAVSSKALGSKRVQATATPTTAEEKEKMKRSLLEGTEKRKSKKKDAGEDANADAPATSSSRRAIEPLDEATQTALKKKSKRRDSDAIGDTGKSKSKRASRDLNSSDIHLADSAPTLPPPTDAHNTSENRDSKTSSKKMSRSGSSSNTAVPPIAAIPPVLPSINSARSDEEKRSPSTPPSFPPPPSPVAARSMSPAASSPRPAHSPRVIGTPSPRTESGSSPLPPPIVPSSNLSASSDANKTTLPPPIKPSPLSGSHSQLPPPHVETTTPESGATKDSIVDDTPKKKKHSSRDDLNSSSGDVPSEGKRDRSSTKGRRDSLTMDLSSVPTASSDYISSPTSSRGGLMRNRSLLSESSLGSPRANILIITPRGESPSANSDAPHVPTRASVAILAASASELSSSAGGSTRDSIDSSSEDTRSPIVLNASMNEIPEPPPMPTVGLQQPPPPPPMPSRAGPDVIRSELALEPELAKARVRRVVPAVEAAVKAWDFRPTLFEQHLAQEVANKTAPEDMLEFPSDDLVLEVVPSQLEHYPPLKDAPQSVLDTYASYTSQLKQIHCQSRWYGTETSQKERVKEYEMRQARLKAEAEKAAAMHPPAHGEPKTSKGDRTGRRASISRSGSSSEQTLGRRASRAIKMTNATGDSSNPEVASPLPDLNEDEDSSAHESVDDHSIDTDSGTSGASLSQASSAHDLTVAPADRAKKDKSVSSKKMKHGSTDSIGMLGPSPPPPSPNRNSGAFAEPPRPASPKPAAGLIRPSNGGTTTPPKAEGRARLSSRGVSGVAGSALNVGAGQSTFALNPKMMAFDDKRRRSEAEKAEQERRGIFEIFTPHSITSEATDHVQPAEPLRPKVDSRLMVHIKGIKLGVGYEEPFFISGAFYDIEKRVRLTETFYADLNDQNELLKSLLGQFYGPAEPESSARRFLANLTYHSPSIYLVLRVSTVLHGDIDDVAEPYSGGSASSKDKLKLMDMARTATSLLGKYHQGFGWAALQVFDEKYNFRLTDDNLVPLNKMKSPLSDQALFDTLMSEEKVKPKVLDAAISFGAFVCTRDKFQLMKYVDSSLVHWPAEQAPSLEVKNDKAGAILKSLVKPPTPITDIVREVDVFELPTDKAAPYWSHAHNFFLYPQTFNLSSSKIKAKTLAAKVFLMSSDDGIETCALPAIFARCADKNLTTHTITSCWWESTSAPMWDEIKFKLPHRITDSHHILFVIYNVNVKVISKKKEGANEPPEVPVAYCWMRLTDHQLFMKNGEYTLPLLVIPQNGQIKGYLNGPQDAIDSEKATFTLRTQLVSTVISQDENLSQYFNLYDKMMESEEKVATKDRKKMFDYITKADGRVLLKFFPVLFNQLFAQMCRTKSTTLQQSIFRVVAVLAQRVFDLTMVSGKLSVSNSLYAYALQYFDLPADAIHNPADIIAANWVILLEQASGAKTLEKAGITPSVPIDEKLSPAELSELTSLANFSLKDISWFLFELIFKSLVLNMAASGQTSRKQITSPELQQSITKLVQFVDLHRRNVGSGFDHINRVLARTFIRLFALTDRGFVLDLIHSHLSKLEGDHSATVFRFRFLQIVTDYEHYVQLNLPSYTPIDSIEVTPVRFWQHHYLAGLYLNELRSALLAGEDSKITRSKAIARFRDLLWKHHLDDRYQLPEYRSRIAGMYFPLLMLLVEKVQMLIEKTQRDESERLEWCLCGLWIMRYMNREAQLRPWWRGESTENLVNIFTFLKYCLDTFHSDEAMREDIMYLMAETYDLFFDDLADELAIEGSKVMEALSLSMIHLLRAAKAEKLTLRLLHIVRTYVIKFKRPLFRHLACYTICGDLTFEVFSLCQSQPRRVMMNASSLLYVMLRANNDEMGHFARMKLQSTLAVSRLVKTPGCNYDEIRNALEAMALYQDTERAASWDNQIREFINRHARIIRENLELVATPASFPDTKAEIFYQISLEYVYSPDLRITWLGNLAQHHEANGNLLEAAVCRVQIASLVSEYLTQVVGQKQLVKGIPDDPSLFAHAFPTIKDEKPFSTIWLEGNTILSPSFSEDGFMKALNEAVDLFIRAEDFEAAAEVQLILANYFKENRRWEMLGPLGTSIASNSQRLYETNRAQSRVPPNFYRVAFFGEGFGSDNGKEFLYRVNPAVRLADFTSSLDQRYIEMFGAEHYERLGNKPIEEYDIDLTKKNYLQIVNCEIYFDYDQANAKDRLTYSDRSFDVKRFSFETPYSPDGAKPSEEVSKTWKRKIILMPAKTFPYVLSRVPILKKEIKILSPIESAVDLLLNIVTRFKEALNCTPPNTKTVQIILQGSVLTQVNAGPLAIIREFLGNASKYPEAEVAKVAEQVRGFVRRCKFGFALNATLIEKEPSLAPLHEEMSKAFKVLVAEASKHIEL